MKVARFFGVVFGAIGTLLMAGTVVLCLVSLNAPVKMEEIPQEAERCAQELLDALNAGDFAAVAGKLYGQPDLGVASQPEDPMGQLVWDAFTASISCEFTGDFYVKGADICRDASITVLEIPSVTETWNGWVHTYFTAEIQAAEDRGELMEMYDENNNFRSELVEQVIRKAVETSLQQDVVTMTKEVTLKLICREGKWWVVPDGALLSCFSGGVA